MSDPARSRPGVGDSLAHPRPPASERRTLRAVALGFASLIVVGTAGYHQIEGWSFVDSLYMTVITMTTVGFGEIHELSGSGRLFTIAFILLAVGMGAYAATAFAQSISDGSWIRYFRRRRMAGDIAGLKHHTIVCGFGRTGRAVVHSLREAGEAFVVVEVDGDVVAHLEDSDAIVVRGSGHDNDVLLAAGIERAKALIACASTDAENVFICLTARSLRADLAIATRCDDLSSASKLEKAGANHVVSTYELAGRTLAAAIGTP